MSSSRPRGRSVSIAAIAARVVGYFVLAWGTLAFLAAGSVPGALTAVLAIAVYTTLPLLAFMRWRGWPFYPGAAFRLLVVRPFWYVQLTLPLVTAAGLLGLLAGLPFGHAIDVGRAFAVLMLSIAVIVFVIGYIGSKQLVVRRVDAAVPQLDPAFEGLKIAQLSDLHVGPHISRRFLAKVAKTTRALAPDIVAVTGDLVDDRAEDVAVYSRMLGELEAPLGVFMIPGNHDIYAGWDDVETALRDAKLGTVLVNETHVIERGSARIAIVGTGDPAAGHHGMSRAAPDIERALANVPADATVIAFAHNPLLWPSLAARGVALTLSGHTHWGQFAIPQRGWSLASPFLEHAMGAHVMRDSLLYINPGTGYFGIPFRIGARPEITLVTLRRGAVATATVHPSALHRRIPIGEQAGTVLLPRPNV
jgi:uncharacterized protein